MIKQQLGLQKTNKQIIGRKYFDFNINIQNLNEEKKRQSNLQKYGQIHVGIECFYIRQGAEDLQWGNIKRLWVPFVD